MIDFIRKTINPPGINKPNRLALFSAIGEVTEKVRADALKAFNAHFPYLADSVKLEEHGRALIIPRLAEDTENEFRGRVTAASFFLMRAGERAYVKDQMRSHFGDRFILKEEFLRVSVRIAELEDKDRQWVREFLDWILNPSISLAVAEWFCLAEELFPEEADAPAIVKNHTDRMYQGLCCDGRFLCDQGAETLCGGSLVCDGSWNCDDFQSVPGTVFDTFLESFFPTGAYRCDGSFDCSGYIKLPASGETAFPLLPRNDLDDALRFGMGLEPLEDRARIDSLCDGSWFCDGSNTAPIADALMPIRIITPIRCDGARTPSCSTCDGTWDCGGSHTCFDGWYCSGDLMREEAV